MKNTSTQGSGGSQVQLEQALELCKLGKVLKQEQFYQHSLRVLSQATGICERVLLNSTP